MLKKSFLLTLFSLLLCSAFAQNETLLSIDGQKISKDEFLRIYAKNNQNPAFDKESLEEYMELFVNFKLKVLEAEALGMDTASAFVNELEGYVKQLEKPYFKDESVIDTMTKQVYERLKWEVNASHILLKCENNAAPSDTLRIYKKMESIRKKAVKGEDFEVLAKKYSEDPSAQQNGGSLGYFTAMRMVLPFELAAFSTEPGQVSPIIRTRFGYHILKVFDKRPSKGEVRVAHIMQAVPKGSSEEKEAEAKAKAYALYDSIVMGEDFSRLATSYSDDRGSAKRGGSLPYFGSGRMVPEFEEAAFALENVGDVSEPVKTAYGWHIIKLLDKKGLAPFEELKPEIRRKVARILPVDQSQKVVVDRLKKEYNVTIVHENLPAVYALLDSTFLRGNWKNFAKNGYEKPVLKIADSVAFTQMDFLNFIQTNAPKGNLQGSIEGNANLILDDFVSKKVTEFEKTRLPVKYPEFRYLVEEYHDGILLFNLTDEMVWSKAVKDTSGLKAFYEANKTNYMWGNRVEAAIYTYSNEAFAKKVMALAKKAAKKQLDITKECAELQNKIYAKDSTFSLTGVHKKYSKGEEANLDLVSWEAGTTQVVPADNSFTLIYVYGPVQAEPKELDEARGLITADYQAELEKQWMLTLHEKYTVNINESVFESLIK